MSNFCEVPSSSHGSSLNSTTAGAIFHGHYLTKEYLSCQETPTKFPSSFLTAITCYSWTLGHSSILMSLPFSRRSSPSLARKGYCGHLLSHPRENQLLPMLPERGQQIMSHCLDRYQRTEEPKFRCHFY